MSFAEQKVVLISGSTGGIGIATVKAFEEKGWKVWAGFHRQIPEDLKERCSTRLLYLDVTDEESIQNGVEKILLEDGRIDALINNAGYGVIGAEESISLQEAKELFDVNFFGSLQLIQAVIPTMRLQRSGHIINISSTSGVRAVPGLGLYAASKFALEGISESLAVTLSPWNIQVSIVEPGTVNNDWIQHCLIKTTPNEPIYNAMTQNLFTKLSLLAKSGQDCNEIGSLIAQIAETQKPAMRYQTSPKVKETVAKKLVDPSGNIMRDEQLAFFKSLTE